MDLSRWMMGFPQHWHGDVARTPALRGYGNAVQVQVATAIGGWVSGILAAQEAAAA